MEASRFFEAFGLDGEGLIPLGKHDPFSNRARRYTRIKYAAMNDTISQISDFLKHFAPLELAEDWDNVGLLIGDSRRPVRRVMTCLTVTPETIVEGIERAVDLIVSHHPFPFQAIKKITTDTVGGQMLWDLMRHGIAVYSPHTAFDSAGRGINQSLAKMMGLTNVQPLKELPSVIENVGAGRMGDFEGIALNELLTRLKVELKLESLAYVGALEQPCRRVAVACGSGGSLLKTAIAAGCDTFVTGETTFHTCLEAKAENVALVLLGHYTSERFACENLAGELKKAFPDLEIWASELESDPINRL